MLRDRIVKVLFQGNEEGARNINTKALEVGGY